MRVEHIVILAYLGIALVVAMCIFAYYCKQYKKRTHRRKDVVEIRVLDGHR